MLYRIFVTCHHNLQWHVFAFKGRSASMILAKKVQALQRQFTTKQIRFFPSLLPSWLCVYQGVLVRVLGLLLPKSVFIRALVEDLLTGWNWISVSIQSPYDNCDALVSLSHSKWQPDILTTLFQAQNDVSVSIILVLTPLPPNAGLTGSLGLSLTRSHNQPSGRGFWSVDGIETLCVDSGASRASTP